MQFHFKKKRVLQRNITTEENHRKKNRKHFISWGSTGSHTNAFQGKTKETMIMIWNEQKINSAN